MILVSNKSVIGVLIVLGLFIHTSCQQTSDIHEAEMKRSEILGMWEATLTQRFVQNNQVLSESVGSYDLLFHEDGTGSNQNLVAGQPDVPFEWFYQFDPERIILIYDQLQIFAGIKTFIFEVETSAPKMHIWTMVMDEPFNCPSCDFVEYTLSLTRE